MIDLSFISKRKETEDTILLDLGNEAVKALLFEKNGPKINILASSLEYFDRYGAFDSQDLEKDIFKKAIFKAIQKLGDNKNKTIILGLPADILKARVVYQNLKRLHSKEIITKKEERQIYQQVLAKAKKNISQIFNQQSGILPLDIQFINLKILEIRIDGYQVPVLSKYDGQDLSFKILATFLPSHYLEEIKAVIASVMLDISGGVPSAVESMDLKVGRVVHEAEGLNSYFKEKTDGIFLDVGGMMTQIFLARNSVLEKIDEFPLAGQIFSKAISEKLGLKEAEARILKERYSKKELSKETADRIKEILWFGAQAWFKSFELKLKEMSKGFLLPLDIVVFGGASQLPDIKDILKSGGRDNSLAGALRVNILDNPQETPALLMAQASLQQ